MAKPSSKPKQRPALTIIPYRTTYTDATQKAVENLFVRGMAVHEVAETLGLKIQEATKRYIQVLEFYTESAGGLTEDWAKVRILCLLRQADERCRVLQERIDRLMAIKTLIKRRDEDGGDFWEYLFPLKEFQALREEQKLIYKISIDIMKMDKLGKKPSIEDEQGYLPPSQRRTNLHSRFQEIREVTEQTSDSLLSTEQHADLEKATTSRSMFEGLDEEDD